MATTNGKNGGLLKGKRHYDKNGKPLGGIKAIVSDTGQAVELEGGEVIINREASKKHWKELSKINQSAGNGVPILPPDSVESNTEEYKLGGNTIEFNPNQLPNKWVYDYAKKIKDKYPKVWDLGGNQFGNEAFKNLERALKRGYWTDNEEWMYVKWKSFNARHKGDFLIAGVIANLKWLNKVDKGWDYMKALIEKEIAKKYPTKTGWKVKYKKGGGVVTYKNKYNKKYGYGENESHDLEDIAKDTKISKKGLQQIYNKGIGAYKTNPQSVRPSVNSKEQWAMARVYSAVMGGKASKVDANELKMQTGGGVGEYKLKDKVDFYYGRKGEEKIISGTITDILKDGYTISTEFTQVSVSPKDIIGYAKKVEPKKKIFGIFKDGGELAKGIKVEKEHKDTYKKLYNREITPQQAPEYVATDHLKNEHPKYYTKLESIESKFANGSKVPEQLFKVGDTATYLERGNTTPTSVKVVAYKTAPNGRQAVVVQNISTGKKTEIYSDRLIQGNGTKTTPEFRIGQYVRLIGSTKLFRVNTIVENTKNNNGFEYTIQTVLGAIKEKGFIPENQLLDAIAKQNLPFIEADTIVNENNEDMTIVKIEGRTMKFLDDNQKVVQYKGMDLWFTADVLSNLDSGLWKLHKTGSTKPKALPQQPTTDVNFSINTPTGKKSKLTYLQQGIVRTAAFKKYFGDWEKSAKDYTADGFKNFDTHYKEVSKVIDLVTLEPRLMYHGTMTEKEFYIFDASRKNKTRPYAYFAQNKEYSEHFTQSSQRNKGTQEVMYQCFLRVLKPFNAIGTDFEAKKEEYGYWVSVISLAITKDKYTTKFSTDQLEKTHKAVESQIGAYIKEICGGNGALAQPFWLFMARDKKSIFKSFLISYGYDGINYAENLGEPYDVNNPAEYTMAVTLFDSDQIKLGDGRNLDFDKMNPDIRFEEGGNLHTQEKTYEPELHKKHKLGKELFGEKYQFEDGGNLIVERNAPTSEKRAYVEDIIAKMKTNN